MTERYPGIDCAHVSTHQALQSIDPSAAGLFSIPTGGESYGYLTLASIARQPHDDPATALAALWKVAYCLGEEQPYALWSQERAAEIAQGLLQDDVSAWTEAAMALSRTVETAGKWLQWIRGGAEAVVQAQFGDKPPRNLPSYLPDEATVTAARLTPLDFLRLENAHWILSDQWNDAAGLFKTDRRWFYVEWGTSA